MKNILITALLIAIVFASLRGSDKKEHNHHSDQNKERHGVSDRSYSNSGSNEDGYTLYNSEDGYTLYNSQNGYTLYNSEDGYTLYNSEDGYTLYNSEEGYTEYPVYNSEDGYTLYNSEDGYTLYNSEEDYTEYPVYNSEDGYTLYNSEDGYTLYNSEEGYTEYPVYNSEDEYTLYDSESSQSNPDKEPQLKQKRNGHNKEQNRGEKKGPRGGKFHNKDHQKSDRKHPHPPRQQDEFPRQVFQTLKKTGKVILEEWNVTLDPSLKNEIRGVLIANLENLLPVADVLNTIEPVHLPNDTMNTVSRHHNPHGHPHPPPPPQPEDGFAEQVFDTLHQIGFEILEQWNREQDMEVKNQIRANLIQQLNELIPAQQIDVATTILDAPIQIDNVYEGSSPRLADETEN